MFEGLGRNGRGPGGNWDIKALKCESYLVAKIIGGIFYVWLPIIQATDEKIHI